MICCDKITDSCQGERPQTNSKTHHHRPDYFTFDFHEEEPKNQKHGQDRDSKSPYDTLDRTSRIFSERRYHWTEEDDLVQSPSGMNCVRDRESGSGWYEYVSSPLAVSSQCGSDPEDRSPTRQSSGRARIPPQPTSPAPILDRQLSSRSFSHPEPIIRVDLPTPDTPGDSPEENQSSPFHRSSSPASSPFRRSPSPKCPFPLLKVPMNPQRETGQLSPSWSMMNFYDMEKSSLKEEKDTIPLRPRRSLTFIESGKLSLTNGVPKIVVIPSSSIYITVAVTGWRDRNAYRLGYLPLCTLMQLCILLAFVPCTPFLHESHLLCLRDFNAPCI